MMAWAAGSAALLGIILIKWGWWPNRRGNEPSCRKCGYPNLPVEILQQPATQF